MRYKRELQNIDTPNKAYLLGLFYADGNISKNQHHSRLYLNDKEILLRIKEKFDFFNYYDKVELGGLHSGINRVREDFINNGCLPDKSFSNKELLRLPFRNGLTNHFIRGYFDGDGGCTLSCPKNKVQKRVYIYTASKIFLEEIQEYLHSYGIIGSINVYNNVYKLSISTSSYKEFYELLYTDAELYMCRKKDKFDNILKTNFFVQRIAPECKFCKSLNTVFNGTSTYKGEKSSRVLCKDCKRNTTFKNCPL